MPKEIEMSSILLRLGLINDKKAQGYKHEVKQGKIKPFDWSQLAVSSAPLRTIKETMDNLGAVPPRTGHMGCAWRDIMQGGAASLSLNNALTRSNFGYPLIFDLNQVPNHQGTKGDVLYWPGYEIVENKTTRMSLVTYDSQSRAFRECDNDRTYLTPLVFSKSNSDITTPISIRHREEINSATERKAKYISEVLLRRWDDTSKVLRSVLNRIWQCDSQEEASKILRLVFDRTTSSDGVLLDGGVIFKGHPDVPTTATINLVHSDSRIEVRSIEDLLDLYKHFLTISSSNDSGDLITKLKTPLPFLSNACLTYLVARLNLDFSESLNGPVLPHFHHGALLMAGAPPMIQGYFPKETNVISLLAAYSSADTEKFNKLHLLLFPAAVFALCPGQDDNVGIKAIDTLLARANEVTGGDYSRTEKTQANLLRAVELWLDECSLPDYIDSRFTQFVNTTNKSKPSNPEPYLSSLFLDSSLLMLCYLYGAIHTVYRNKQL